MIKVIDDFWKLWGIIVGFNESRRHIASRVEKTSYDAMSDILFCATPKGYLPHYSYIFRKPYKFGTNMDNLACSRLRTLLHLEIQKGKEDMKTSTFQKNSGATAEYTKTLIMATKG